MKSIFFTIVLFVSCQLSSAQVDIQKRFQSDSRKYYVWNNEFEKYELMETEFENSIIDIREIGSKTNGYIVISMYDNGMTRLHHGSITNFVQDSEEQGTWYIRSKFMKAKLTYNPADNTMTYFYDGDNKRYQRLMIFSVSPDELPNAGLKPIARQ